MSYILYDLNARDPFVSTSEDMMLADEKCVVQQAQRLLTTEYGEIPYFRNYGLNVKRFLQLPLTKETANSIYEYVKGQVANFVDGEIVRANVDMDAESGVFKFDFFLRVKETGNIVQLDTWTINVSSTN